MWLANLGGGRIASGRDQIMDSFTWNNDNTNDNNDNLFSANLLRKCISKSRCTKKYVFLWV